MSRIIFFNFSEFVCLFVGSPQWQSFKSSCKKGVVALRQSNLISTPPIEKKNQTKNDKRTESKFMCVCPKFCSEDERREDFVSKDYLAMLWVEPVAHLAGGQFPFEPRMPFEAVGRIRDG